MPALFGKPTNNVCIDPDTFDGGGWRGGSKIRSSNISRNRDLKRNHFQTFMYIHRMNLCEKVGGQYCILLYYSRVPRSWKQSSECVLIKP